MPDNIINEFGHKLKKKRKEQNLTQDNLSELTGISKRHIANIEKGTVNASIEVVSILAKELKMSIDNIIFSNDLLNEENFIKDVAIKMSLCTENQKYIVIKVINLLLDELLTHKT